MGMFECKGQDASALVADAYAVATSTTLYGCGISKPLPAGWVRPLAAEPGLSPDDVGAEAFKGKSALGFSETRAQFGFGRIGSTIATTPGGVSGVIEGVECFRFADRMIAAGDD